MTTDTTSSPPPTFDILPLGSEVRRAVDDLGYAHPTPVQRAVFEPAVRGRDLVVQARTGTGKTAAFGLPLVDSLVKKATPRVQALVLCPTRELALQVHAEIERLSKYRGVKTVAVYGGAPMPRQVEAIRNGAQILVGTPGRVLDHLQRGTLDPSSISIMILDESDEMLSMGFLPQINAILSKLPEARQTLLFSATLPPDIRRMAESKLRDPEFLTLSGDHIGALEINHYVYLTRGDKLNALLQILEVENPESAVIFCNTKDETKRVAGQLVQQGFAADWLNADLAQSDRERVMEATRKGALRFLVATDVAARGIDISHLTHVINHDLPESSEAYVHRTGRTGRAGRTGTAISLIAPSDIGNLYMLRLTYKIRPIERELPNQRELKSREETDVLNLFVEAFASKSVHSDDLALARRLMTHEHRDQIVAALMRDHLGARAEPVEEARAARRSRTVPQSENAPAEPPKRGTSARETPDAEKRREPQRLVAPNNVAPSNVAPLENREPPKREPSKRVELESSNGEPKSAEAALAEPPSLANERDENADASAESIAEVFVRVGRQDGAKPSDFETALESQGIRIDELAYVRVRHHHSFIGVKPELADRIIEALSRTPVRGKQTRPERARRR